MKQTNQTRTADIMMFWGVKFNMFVIYLINSLFHGGLFLILNNIQHTIQHTI